MSDTAVAHEAPTSTGIDHKKLIMWLFLASDCMFFGTLISTHLLYRKLYPPASPTPKATSASSRTCSTSS